MKRFLPVLVLLLMFAFPQINFAQTDDSIDQKIANIGLFAEVETDNRKEIEKLLKSHLKYANSQNLKKLESLYTENYKNFDGLSRENYFKMIQETWGMYTNLTYNAQIKNIFINGNYADVEVFEEAKGKTKEPCETTKKIGNIQSQSVVVYNLKKVGKKWKIASDNILQEKTFLLYGDTNNLAMDLYAPSQAAKGAQYDAIFDVKLPKGYFALGSITNEEITFPQKQPQEIFRNIKQDNILERVLTANKNNKNEYAVASIGLTKPDMTDDNKININIVGMGFLMSRVNVFPLSKGE